MKELINQIGVIDTENIEPVTGQIEFRLPIKTISTDFDSVLDDVYEEYTKTYGSTDNVCYEVRIVYCFGCANPDFSLTVYVFNADDENKCIIRDELELNISKPQKKALRVLLMQMLFV